MSSKEEKYNDIATRLVETVKNECQIFDLNDGNDPWIIHMKGLAKYMAGRFTTQKQVDNAMSTVTKFVSEQILKEHEAAKAKAKADAA